MIYLVLWYYVDLNLWLFQIRFTSKKYVLYCTVTFFSILTHVSENKEIKLVMANNVNHEDQSDTDSEDSPKRRRVKYM